MDTLQKVLTPTIRTAAQNQAAASTTPTTGSAPVAGSGPQQPEQGPTAPGRSLMPHRYTLSEAAQQRGPVGEIWANDIILTQAEVARITEKAVAAALLEARQDIWRVETAHRKQERQRLAERPLTAADLWRMVPANAHLHDPLLGRKGPGHFELDEYGMGIFRMLCLYFARDARFETENPGMQLDRGIILAGNIGCGKTTMLRVFRAANPRAGMAFHCASYLDLENAYATNDPKKGGTAALAKYCQQPYFIDDMGREDIGRDGEGIQHMGKKTNLIEYLIEMRYQSGTPFEQLHMSMNISKAQIISRYGKRASSRFQEMFNIIDWDPRALNRRNGEGPSSDWPRA